MSMVLNVDGEKQVWVQPSSRFPGDGTDPAKENVC